MKVPGHPPRQPAAPPLQVIPQRLQSWKEIASYFDRDIRTVQLWEKKEGLPVHRHEHDARSSVFAVPSELEQWFDLRRKRSSNGAQPPVTDSPSLGEQPPRHLLVLQSAQAKAVGLGAAALAVIVAGAGLAGWLHGHPATPPQSLTVVLADFVNTTGEPVFDDTLNTALRAKLQQSPYLPLLPDARLQLALRYMGRTAGQRLTLDAAREACEREGGQVVLQGSIANAPKGYLVGLRAVDCHNGKIIADEQMPVEFRTSVLDGLDHVAEAIRPALGESADSVKRYSVSLDDATTGSLEALTAYTEGNRLWNSQGESAALPHFRHAVEIDPNFAIAYARLGTIYGNMGESQRSNEALRNAFDLRNRVTEWERYYITSHYFGFVTGDVSREMQAYQQWAQAYPHDMAWTINLSVDYSFTGQFDKAIELQKRAIREIPGLSPAYGNLAQYYIAADRPDEAQTVLDQAAQAHVQDSNTQLAAYWLAFYRNQPAAMDSIARAAAGHPGLEDLLLNQQAATADSGGHLSEGLTFADRAAASAALAGNQEIRSEWLASEAVRQAAFGETGPAHQLLTRALDSRKAAASRDVQVLTALALTLAQTPPATGPRAARDLAFVLHAMEGLNRSYPEDTLIQSYWLPVLRARIAYVKGQSASVPALLEGTAPYDLGIFTPGQCMDAAFVRGQALLASHQPAAAAIEFRRVLAHRGLVLNCPTETLSQLNLARSLALTGDTASARTAYQDLFARWKDASPQLPLVRRAVAEYAALRPPG